MELVERGLFLWRILVFRRRGFVFWVWYGMAVGFCLQVSFFAFLVCKIEGNGAVVGLLVVFEIFICVVE